MDDNKKEFNEEELLKKVRKAAEQGSRSANLKASLLSILPTIAIIALLGFLIIPKINALHDGLKSFFKIDTPVEGHDMTISNSGIFGYTAADFEEAILGDSEKLKKIEVYQQEVSDISQITDTGLLNLGVFTRNQLITYNGTVVYTVDLSSLKNSDINIDQETKIITLKIPHAVQEEINIPEDRIQFGDTSGGLLAFGDIKMTAEQASQIQASARKKMQEKLDSDKTIEVADRFAKLSVWEMYSPLIKSVAKDYSLDVEFK